MSMNSSLGFSIVLYYDYQNLLAFSALLQLLYAVKYKLFFKIVEEEAPLPDSLPLQKSLSGG